MYPEALLGGSVRFYGLGHPSALRLYILFEPKILIHLRARSIWTHSRLDSDQKGIKRHSSAQIAPKSFKIQDIIQKHRFLDLVWKRSGSFWATLCDKLMRKRTKTNLNTFKYKKFEEIRNLILIKWLKVPSLTAVRGNVWCFWTQK